MASSNTSKRLKNESSFVTISLIKDTELLSLIMNSEGSGEVGEYAKERLVDLESCVFNLSDL